MSVQLKKMSDVGIDAAVNSNIFIYFLTKEPRGGEFINKIGGLVKEKWGISHSATDVVENDCESDVAIVHHESVVVALGKWIDACVDPLPSVAVDISCMPRTTMAAVIQAIFESSMSKPVRLTILYSLANYTKPPQILPPNEDIRPICDWFAGWPSDATASTSLIVGLGYENDKAVGACEYFDAGETWVFNPKSPIKEYDEEVMRNNNELISRATRRDRVIPYAVDRPTQTFGQLVMTVSQVLPRMNPVLLPFGPKIFFILNLLVSALYREVGVWHVTGDSHLPEAFHTSSDVVSAFQIDLAPN